MIFQKIKPNPKLFLQVSVLKSDSLARLDWGGILNRLVQTTCVVDEEAESERGRIICWSFVESLALAGNGGCPVEDEQGLRQPPGRAELCCWLVWSVADA